MKLNTSANGPHAFSNPVHVMQSEAAAYFAKNFAEDEYHEENRDKSAEEMIETLQDYLKEARANGAEDRGIRFADINLRFRAVEVVEAAIRGDDYEKLLSDLSDEVIEAAHLFEELRGIASSAKIEGVTYSVINDNVDIYVQATYAEDLEYTDEPWAPFASIEREFDESGLDNLGNGRVQQWIRFDF